MRLELHCDVDATVMMEIMPVFHIALLLNRVIGYPVKRSIAQVYTD